MSYLQTKLFRTLVTTAIGLMVGVGLFGCASTSLPPAPPQASSPDYNYVIGPGDTINIVVWRNQSFQCLSQSVPMENSLLPWLKI